ncbi:MAG: Fcp1-like phosphatase [Amphiamblys sp. WSBS2006]|nr:MAG: Fcp1-like phosphatase [Amphiamblys sp. WSBS2006]
MKRNSTGHRGKEHGETETCSHPVRLNGLCAVCGKTLPHEHREEAGHTIQAYDKKISYTKEYAAEMSKQEQETLHAEKKLALIIDLDQTIIHTTYDSADPALSSGNATHRLAFTDGTERTYHVKTRPLLKQFLKRMSRLYQMHIYTMGTQEYAKAVLAQIVDPQGKYFGSRVVTREGTGDFEAKSIERVCTVEEHMAVVLDDRSDVWTNTGNLIKVPPYTFFGCGDINKPAAAQEHRQQKTEGDKVLERAANILTDIHRRYYTGKTKNTEKIIRVMKKKKSFPWPAV